MKLRSLGYALMLASVAMSGQALAGGKHKGHKPQPLKGCYDIVGGLLTELPAEDNESIGTYNMVLVPQDARGRGRHKHVYISGPNAGREEPGGHEEEEGEHEEGEEEIHGKHWFGTFDRSGVFITSETSANVTGVGCIDPVTGIPGLVHGSETLEFVRGTGIFSGLIGGEVVFTGTFDRCTDPALPVTSFPEIEGEMCFQE